MTILLLGTLNGCAKKLETSKNYENKIETNKGITNSAKENTSVRSNSKITNKGKISAEEAIILNRKKSNIEKANDILRDEGYEIDDSKTKK